MGDTRVRRGDSALVSPAQIAALPGRLLPGDVLLERREWFLSNLGLPGFWTHAALYVGTPEERRAFFDDAGVRALAREEGQPDGDLDALLAAREPAAAAASRTPDAAGHPPRVLEAISEGVSFTTLEHSAAADSIAVLRPLLDRRARAVALLRAFHYAGRPYDFDFDFLTDASLVCSELVYKAYEPGPASTTPRRRRGPRSSSWSSSSTARSGAPGRRRRRRSSSGRAGSGPSGTRSSRAERPLPLPFDRLRASGANSTEQRHHSSTQPLRASTKRAWAVQSTSALARTIRAAASTSTRATSGLASVQARQYASSRSSTHRQEQVSLAR
jgi:hypothetical protein